MSEKHLQGAPHSLEADVMARLWSAAEPLTPGDVKEALGRDLAYTTVMTTLGRLYAKGLVIRTKVGRAFAYSPVQRADDVAAQTMSDVLSRGIDPAEVLSRFVDRLGTKEEQVLRRLLERTQAPKE